MKKSASKRIKVTKTGKMLHRPIAVNHFRSKKTGQKLLLKKQTSDIPKGYKKVVRQMLSGNK